MEGTYDVIKQIVLDKPAFDAVAHEHFAAHEEGFEHGNGGGGQARVGMTVNLGI